MPWVNVEDLPAPQPTPKEIDDVERYARQKKTRSRFYADENFPAGATEILREMGFDVRSAQEAGKQSHPDQNQIAEARRLRRVLITCDHDYLDNRRYPLTTFHAVIVFDFGRGADMQIVSAYQCLAYIGQFPQFYDKWCKVRASPGEWTESVRYLDGTTSRTRLRIRKDKLQEWAPEESD